MTNEQALKDMAMLGKAFQFLYSEALTEGGRRPLIGVASEYIQISIETFQELFKGNKFTTKQTKGGVYPYEIACIYDGVNFIAVCTKEEYSKLF